MRLDQLKEAVARDNKGVVVPILDPDNEPYLASDGSPVTFTVVGLQSEQRRKAENEQAKRSADFITVTPTPDDARNQRHKLVAACVVDWHGVEDEAGAPVPFSTKNVIAVFEIDQRILQRVEVAIHRHDSFFAKPAANSAST